MVLTPEALIVLSVVVSILTIKLVDKFIDPFLSIYFKKSDLVGKVILSFLYFSIVMVIAILLVIITEFAI